MSTLAKKIRDEKCPVILYELIPPASDTDVEATTAYAKCAVELMLNPAVRVDAFNIPEIRAEEREGQRTHEFFSKVAPREFGRELNSFIHGDIEIVVNHSPVYDPENIQVEWLNECIKQYNQTNLILVGGESHKIEYPGPSIEKMLELIHLNYPDTFFCGGITIPTRRDEPERMLKKIRAGIDYFTSQIIYEPFQSQLLLKDYQEACEKEGIAPKRVFFSFAPVTCKKDIDFMRWLDVKMPDEVEKDLMSADIGAGWRSIKIMCDTLTEILTFHDKHNLNVPIGINIEHVTHRNFEITKDVIEKLGDIYYHYMRRYL